MRFRFTIRDLLWLTALIAMAVAWRVDRQRLAHLNNYNLRWETSTAGEVVIEFTDTGDKFFLTSIGPPKVAAGPAPQ